MAEMEFRDDLVAEFAQDISRSMAERQMRNSEVLGVVCVLLNALAEGESLATRMELLAVLMKTVGLAPEGKPS